MKSVHVIKQIMNFLKCFGLDKYLVFYTDKEKTQQIPKIIADIYESFIAAVYLVYGIEKASQIVIDSISNIIDINNIDKSYLEIAAQKRKKNKKKRKNKKKSK